MAEELADDFTLEEDLELDELDDFEEREEDFALEALEAGKAHMLWHCCRGSVQPPFASHATFPPDARTQQ